jgi:hypothetical protein
MFSSEPLPPRPVNTGSLSEQINDEALTEIRSWLRDLGDPAAVAQTSDPSGTRP